MARRGWPPKQVPRRDRHYRADEHQQRNDQPASGYLHYGIVCKEFEVPLLFVTDTFTEVIDDALPVMVKGTVTMNWLPY